MIPKWSGFTLRFNIGVEIPHPQGTSYVQNNNYFKRSLGKLGMTVLVSRLWGIRATTRGCPYIGQRNGTDIYLGRFTNRPYDEQYLFGSNYF